MLADAQRHGRLDTEHDKLQRIPLLIVDEVGYIPFDPQAANLMFMLVSRRYERASLIVTSNKPFSAWGEIFGDDVTAAAMIDRLVRHAEILTLTGCSYVKQGANGAVSTYTRSRDCVDGAGTVSSRNTTRARWRLRQRRASIRLLPSAARAAR
jgi:DNA replication protein DnaC